MLVHDPGAVTNFGDSCSCRSIPYRYSRSSEATLLKEYIPIQNFLVFPFKPVHIVLPGGCEVGASMSFACSPIETQSCTCIEDPCPPYCDMMRGPAWIDPCTDAPIPGSGDPACFPFGEIHCLHIGDTTEGWYDTQWDGEHLVKLGPCQPRWQCEFIW